VARFCASMFDAGRRFDLVPTRANGQPAFGAYLHAATGDSHGTGLFVLTLTGDRICALTRFDNSVLPWFGLPRSLPASASWDKPAGCHGSRAVGHSGTVLGVKDGVAVGLGPLSQHPDRVD
jgi:hypothetical protein